MQPERRDRLGPGTFDLPIPEIRIGYRSAVYFCRAKKILEAERPDQVVTIQVFQRGDSVLCGIDEALAILEVGAGAYADHAAAQRVFGDYLAVRQEVRQMRHRDLDQVAEMRRQEAALESTLDRLWKPGLGELEIKALRDGDRIQPWEPVLEITGPLHLFVHLESVYLGVLARRTKVATNVARVVAETHGKPLLFFADRFDHFATQGGDGYAAHIGGARGVATASMGAWWGEEGMGTMPHALIAAFDGDVVQATAAFRRNVPEADLIALVDFTNNCVMESLRCAREFGDSLWGVRLDTSGTLVDQFVLESGLMGDFKPTGVCVLLVRAVRQALDDEGYQHVKIAVSGGFDADKIRSFEQVGAPVDAYAVGSSLLRGGIDFTADCVAPVAKMGRWRRDSSRLEEV
jgi:nicotinate phosphoribosyltransferase